MDTVCADVLAEAIGAGAEGVLVVKGIDLNHKALSRILPTQAKCCQKCAFRSGSPERSDPFRWQHLCEVFEEGAGFLCHEGIPGHAEQKPGEPLRLCAGRAAMEGKPIVHLCFPALKGIQEG